jgi:hypothetical protein
VVYAPAVDMDLAAKARDNLDNATDEVQATEALAFLLGEVGFLLRGGGSGARSFTIGVGAEPIDYEFPNATPRARAWFRVDVSRADAP